MKSQRITISPAMARALRFIATHARIADLDPEEFEWGGTTKDDVTAALEWVDEAERRAGQ